VESSEILSTVIKKQIFGPHMVVSLIPVTREAEVEGSWLKASPRMNPYLKKKE
jgi:hypothetical protein